MDDERQRLAALRAAVAAEIDPDSAARKSLGRRRTLGLWGGSLAFYTVVWFDSVFVLLSRMRDDDIGNHIVALFVVVSGLLFFPALVIGFVASLVPVVPRTIPANHTHIRLRPTGQEHTIPESPWTFERLP